MDRFVLTVRSMGVVVETNIGYSKQQIRSLIWEWALGHGAWSLPEPPNLKYRRRTGRHTDQDGRAIEGVRAISGPRGVEEMIDIGRAIDQLGYYERRAVLASCVSGSIDGFNPDWPETIRLGGPDVIQDDNQAIDRMHAHLNGYAPKLVCKRTDGVVR